MVYNGSKPYGWFGGAIIFGNTYIYPFPKYFWSWFLFSKGGICDRSLENISSWIHGTLTLFAKGHGGSSSISCPWWWWEGLGCATGICLCADSVVRCLPYKLVLRKLQHPKTLIPSEVAYGSPRWIFFGNWLEKVQFFPFSKQPYQRNNKADVACCRLHIVALQEL